jgi:hypothetical protein
MKNIHADLFSCGVAPYTSSVVFMEADRAVWIELAQKLQSFEVTTLVKGSMENI